MNKEFTANIFITALAFIILLILILCAGLFVSWAWGIESTVKGEQVPFLWKALIGVWFISFWYLILRLLTALSWIWKVVSNPVKATNKMIGEETI